MSTDNTAKKLLASLRNHAPHRVRAYTSDDEYRDIAVPQRRKRWAQVIEAIEARAWSRVELLDKSGGVLGYVENAEPATAIEELSDGNTKGNKLRHECEWIVNLVVKAQRDSMAFRDAEVKSLLQAQGDVVREVTAAMHSLTGMYRMQVDAAKEVATLQATAANGDGSFDLKGLMEAAPAIMQALPMLRALLAGGGASTPNGAPKKPPGS